MFFYLNLLVDSGVSCTASLCVRGGFYVRCYSYWGPDYPVCFAVIIGSSPAVPTEIYGQDQLLEIVFSWPS